MVGPNNTPGGGRNPIEDDELLPHAGNLATSLQGMTYDFSRAIADVVDNSVAAGAQNVWVIISDGSEEDDVNSPYVAIVDDGHGMDADGIRTALMYGSPSSTEKTNLGRFGLGLKTASTSQCHVLTVASRKSPSSQFDVRRWDINYLRSAEADGKWIPLIPSIDEVPQQALDLVSGSGTIVLWNDLSKLVPGIDTLNEANLASFLGARKTECEDHLALVFHRFMQGTCKYLPERTINISVNGELLEALDPFVSTHRAHRRYSLADAGLELEHMSGFQADGGLALALYGNTMQLAAHVVPRKDEFHAETARDGTPRTAEEAWKRAGLGNWNDTQGVYFYRLDRVIQAGGWCQLMGRDEHTKLARLSIDVDRSWDGAILLNITKTRVIIPEPLRKDLRTVFSSLRGYAKQVYDGKADLIRPIRERDESPPPRAPIPKPLPRSTTGSSSPSPAHTPSTTEAPASPQPTSSDVPMQPGELAFLRELESYCQTQAEQEVFRTVVKRLQSARKSS